MRLFVIWLILAALGPSVEAGVFRNCAHSLKRSFQDFQRKKQLQRLRVELKALMERETRSGAQFNEALVRYAEVLEEDQQLQEAAWLFMKAGHLRRAVQVEKRLEETLKKDAVISAKEIGLDTNNPTFLLILSSGVRGVWKPRLRFSQKGMGFDTSTNELTAYQLDREIRNYRVPVTVKRNWRMPLEKLLPSHMTEGTRNRVIEKAAGGVFTQGTLQAYVGGVKAHEMEWDLSEHELLMSLRQSLALFDYWIGNRDRNTGASLETTEQDNLGNLLITYLSHELGVIDPVAIDHHDIHAFRHHMRASPHVIQLEDIALPVDRREYEQIKAFEPETYAFVEPLHHYLISEMRARQEEIVAYIEAKRQELGDEAVFNGQP